MTDIAGQIGQTSAQTYPVWTVAGAVLAFVGFLGLAMMGAGGAFEYPLDDVYIHLAMAEQMAAGGYGVNAGEYASAASSPLYPVLLMPFAGSDVQRFLPLFWNVVALVASAWLLGRLFMVAELGRAGLLLAVVAPFALFMQNNAYSSMEHMLHTAASLAIVLGLWRFVETRHVGWLLVAGVALAPAFRLEGLAMAMAAGGVVLLLGRPVAGLALAALATLPVIGLMVFLTSLGLEPLPNSVTAKLPATHAENAGLLESVGSTLNRNAGQIGGRLVLALTLVTWLIALVLYARGDKARGLIGLAVATAAFAHLAMASTGWLDRYENYLVVSLFGVLCLLVASLTPTARWAVLGGALAGSLLTYAPKIDNNLAGLRAIHLQQAEMSRFAKDHLKAPVAVNDLGYVAWANPNYVLDLWGLASAEALRLRLSDAPDGWADPLADRYGVRAAMIYEDWLGPALGPDWVRMGRLVLLEHHGALLGGDVVSFYARNAAEAAALQADLKDWAAGLPPGTGFAFDDWEGGT